MNRQELFNMAYVGLAKQGFERSVGQYNCRYRGERGRKCAIGFCIPDKKYKPGLESAGVEYSIDVRRAAGIKEIDAEWAGSLQLCHDQGHDPELMRNRLQAFAFKHNLSIPELPDEQGWDSQHMEQLTPTPAHTTGD